ncbi:MAG: THUMP domain-containing protein, partial [Spirochaetia bacterium]
SSGTLIATCAGGLETVLEQEISDRGWQVTGSVSGAVRFAGSELLLAEANIVLRTASRILVPVTTGRARNYDELYRLASRTDWHRLAPPTFSIGVTVVSSDRELSDTRFAALRVKDAIVDVQRRRTGKRSRVERRTPEIGVVAHIAGGSAEISLDSTGRPLHIRGYRTEAGTAPLRETVAAGMVLLSGWDRKSPLLDPFCGSGTILIEAALIAAEIHPGIRRDDFTFLRWPGADRAAFDRLRSKLRPSRRQDHGGEIPQVPLIHGADRDATVVEVAQRNAERAGVQDLITIDRRDFFTDPQGDTGGMILTNPPYGERIELEDAAGFCSRLGDHLKQNYTGSTAWILSANLGAMKHIGLRTSAKIPLFNGGLESRLYRIALF